MAFRSFTRKRLNKNLEKKYFVGIMKILILILALVVALMIPKFEAFKEKQKYTHGSSSPSWNGLMR